MESAVEGKSLIDTVTPDADAPDRRKVANTDVTGNQYLFKEDAKEDMEIAAKNEFDRKVGLLITPKKLTLLREFGYDVCVAASEPYDEA